MEPLSVHLPGQFPGPAGASSTEAELRLSALGEAPSGQSGSPPPQVPGLERLGRGRSEA